jgi:hypothetical protein
MLETAKIKKVEIMTPAGDWLDVTEEFQIAKIKQDGENEFTIAFETSVSFWRYPLTWLREWLAIRNITRLMNKAGRGRFIVEVPGGADLHSQWN